VPRGLRINTSSGLVTSTVGSTANAGSPDMVTVMASDGTVSVSPMFTRAVSPAITLTVPGNPSKRSCGTTLSHRPRLSNGTVPPPCAAPAQGRAPGATARRWTAAAAEVQALDAFFTGRDGQNLHGRPWWWNLLIEEE
jgi:hypothetical protein